MAKVRSLPKYMCFGCKQEIIKNDNGELLKMIISCDKNPEHNQLVFDYERANKPIKKRKQVEIEKTSFGVIVTHRGSKDVSGSNELKK